MPWHEPLLLRILRVSTREAIATEAPAKVAASLRPTEFLRHAILLLAARTVKEIHAVTSGNAQTV